VTWWNSVTNLNLNRAIRGGVIAISVFDLMTLNIALRVALGSWIIFTKFDLRQLIRVSVIAFLMLIRYVTLWPWPLTRWTWKFVVHQASRDQSRYEIHIFYHILSYCILSYSYISWILQERNCCKFSQLQQYQILLKSVNIWPTNYVNEKGELFETQCTDTKHRIANWIWRNTSVCHHFESWRA